MGFLDVGQDGLQTAHDVGLWDDSGNLLTQVSVGSGTSAPLVGFFRYASITPITLTAGQTYRVAGSFQSGTDNFSFQYSGLTNNHAITIPNEAEISGSSLTFPTSLFGDIASNGNSIGADIQFNSATPVPFEFEGTGGVLVLGGGWLLRRHLKKKKSTKV